MMMALINIHESSYIDEQALAAIEVSLRRFPTCFTFSTGHTGRNILYSQSLRKFMNLWDSDKFMNFF